MANYSIEVQSIQQCEPISNNEWVYTEIPFETVDNNINISIDKSEFRGKIVIKCDGKDDINNFNLEYYDYELLTIDRNRCELDIYIKPNKTQYNNYFNIILTHVCDITLQLKIEIEQEADTFDLSTNSNTYNLKTIVGEKDNDRYKNVEKQGNCLFYEDTEIPITISGGKCIYDIYNVYKMHKNTNGAYEMKSFDNGFILMKYADKIVIRNYGKVFVETDDYYVIVIQHRDKKDLKHEINIKYEDNTSDFVTRNRQKVKIKDMEIVFTKKPEEAVLKKMKPIVYTIEFEEDVENYTIYNKSETEIGFNVTQDGEECKLKTKTTSTGDWCVTDVKEYYDEDDKIERKLIIKIKDFPISERKANIKLYILDKPEIYRTFTIINKPS